MPRHIAKWGRPLPYFMKYRDPYYARQKLSRSPSNMNRLCWQLEKWDKGIRWKRTFQEFDYALMIDSAVEVDSAVADAVEQIYLAFGKETRRLATEQTKIRQYKDADIKAKYTAYEAKNFSVSWKSHYDRYRGLCSNACPDRKMLANILVTLGYVKYPKRDKRFMWNMAGDGIVANIAQVSPVTLPMRDMDGKHGYLGRKYTLMEVDPNQLNVEGNREID